MPNVLILGGSGFVGKAIINEFKNKYETYATYYNHPINEGKSFKLDIEDLKSFEGILNSVKPDIIISCLRGGFDRQLALHINAAEFLKENNGRLYFYSTTNVFDNDYSRPHFEDDLPDSQTDYGRFKIECEKRITEILGDNACILRLPQVWGKDSPRLVSLINQLRNNEKITVYPKLNISTTTDVMIAKRLYYIIEHNMSGKFHLVSEDTINHKDFYCELISVLRSSKAEIEENLEETGYFALLSKRSGEFTDELIHTNKSVIQDIIA